MNKEVDKVFERINANPNRFKYESYFKKIAPQNKEDIFWRFVFAFMSIHTTYRSNVLGYQYLKTHEECWESCDNLCEALKKARCGMHNNRAKYLWKFRQDFFYNSYIELEVNKSLQHQRNFIARALTGIGMAKVSFALEMILPTQSEVVCLDVHHLRLYGKDEKVSVREYMAVENDWCKRAKDSGITPFAARNIFWDTLKDKPSPRFWSFVFEPGGEHLYIDSANNLTFEDVANNGETLDNLFADMQEHQLPVITAHKNE